MEAVKIAETNPDRKTIIFSDSQSVLRSLGRNKMSIKESSFILEIKKRITKCSENSQLIQLCWIPSHLGVGGNEEADELAKAAADISIHNIKKIPFSDFYQYFAEEANKNTKKYTLDLGISKGKNYFQNFFTTHSRPWFQNKGFSRNFIVTINRLRSNHYNLASSLARVRIVNSPACHCGFDHQDIEHIVWDCPTFMQHRNNLLKNLRKVKNFTFPSTVEELLKRPESKPCKLIHVFLMECELKI